MSRRHNAQGWHAPSGRLYMVAVTEMGLYVPQGALRLRTFLVLQIFHCLLTTRKLSKDNFQTLKRQCYAKDTRRSSKASH